MKKLIIICVTVSVGLFVSSAFALFSSGDFESGLDDWNISGSVSLSSDGSNSYAVLGSPDAKIWQNVTVAETGDYALDFDYRGGFDLNLAFGVSDDAGFLSPDAYSLFLPPAADWTHIQTPPPPIYLEAGKDYSLGFVHSDLAANAPLDLDNVSISIISALPTPGAILLGGIGIALVGWLRRRRTL